MKMVRTYAEKDVKRLITAAGGRCSFRVPGEVCKRLLVSGNSVIGEKAHIVAVSPQGPRYDGSYDTKKINSYDNLIWMCPTHHTIIDKLDDVKIYSSEVLRKMKEDHERDIRDGNIAADSKLYDVIAHDYSSLSTLFEYVDINKLYSSCLNLPRSFDAAFSDLIDMVEAYEDGNGKFHLKDKYLNMLFVEMLQHLKYLFKLIVENFNVEPIAGEIATTEFKCTLYDGKTKRNIEWVEYWLCLYQGAVEQFLSAMRSRYPEIFYQPLYRYSF